MTSTNDMTPGKDAFMQTQPQKSAQRFHSLA